MKTAKSKRHEDGGRGEEIRFFARKPAVPLMPAASKTPVAAQLIFSRIKSEQKSLRPEFLRSLAQHFGVVTFVETSTFLGDTAARAAEFISEVHTIELAPELARKAAKRFAAQPQVHVHAGHSAKLLPKILATLSGPSLLWLDGHYSEGETARGDSNTLILTELRAVQQSGRKDAVILIDGLHLFEKPPGPVEKNSTLHGHPSINQLHEAVLAIDPDYQFLILGDVALAFPNTGTLTLSPVVMALTLSRLFDGKNLSLNEIFEAENIISQAQGEEREAIQWLPRQHAAVERYGLGLHYRLWHALTLFGENKFTAAAEEFTAVIALGFKHWRAHWYRAVALVAAGQFAPALEILKEILKHQPNFPPAKLLCEKIGAAAPQKLPPMLAPEADALPALQAASLWEPGQPLRLHLGCGEQHFDGYVNLDYPPAEHTCQTKIGADIFADITKLRFPWQSVDEIRLHHVFEHFKRAEALALLIVWHEILKVGGRLHLETPDLEGCAHQLVSEIPLQVKQVVIRHCFGSQEAGWANHYDGWTAERYEHVLGQFGFRVQTKNWSWPHPPHLANVEAIGTKTRNLSRAELLAVADQMLSEYMTMDVPSERAMCEVWRKAMRDFLEAIKPAPMAEVFVKLQGGLGNQMFQFAAGLALARSCHSRLKLDLSFLRDRRPRPNFTQRDYCLDLFQLPADCEVVPDCSADAKRLPHHIEQQFHFGPQFFNLGPNVYLDGYFQSPRFFEPVREEVMRTFRSFAAPLSVEQRALAEQIAARPAVCLNVRRGDFVANPVTNEFHGVCDQDYFHRAVAEVQRRVPDAHFFIFSDDIEWCRTANLTNGAPFTLVPHDLAGDRFGAYLQLMMACRHFILPNSSFGWWAAFLSSTQDKVVVVPTPWFDNPVNNTMDLLPASWIQLPKNRTADPLVSVVISCHNYAHYLPEAVGSVCNQTFRNLEIILVDDGSTDDSATVAQRLAAEAPADIPFRIVRLDDVGPAAARRFGVAQALGKYYLPLDADDRIAPDFLAKTVPLVEANAKLGFVYVDTVFFGDKQERHYQPEYDFARLYQGNFISHTSLIRKAAFDDVGGYDPENWGYYEDWDLWIRLGEKGWFGKHLGEPLFFYRHHFNSSLSLFASRLDPIYRAFLYSRHPEGYSQAIIEAARQALAEMPLGWNLRPPMRNVEQLKSLILQDPRNRHVLYFLGCALIKSGACAEAETVLKNLLAMYPDDTQAQDVLKQLALMPARPDSGALVSVIVPTYNRPDWLGETLRSILTQTYRDFEIIVVNDAGLDISHIIEPLNTEGQIRLITHEKNKGLAAARNTGIRAARGEYIAYLDDDDIFHPHHLATLVGHLKATGSPVVYSDAQRCTQRKEGDRHVVVERAVLYSHDWDRDKILVHNFVPVLCFLHRKQCIEEAGWFDESLTTHEDWDLWMRMSRRFDFSHIKEVTCEFRWRDDGSSMSSARRADFLRTAQIIYQKNPEFVENRGDVQASRQQFLFELRRSLGVFADKATTDSLVSIVIPVFNRLDMTRPCLEAIHRETMAGTFEIIVVDNASNDGTREFLAAEQAAGRLRTIRNEENLGFSKACNQGIRAALGGFILLLNNDTVPLAGWLEAMLAEIRVSAQIAAVGSCLLYPGGELIQHAGVRIGAGGGSIHPYHPWRLQRLDRVPAAHSSRDCQAVTGACLLVHRTVLDEVGLLDEAYINGFEDVDLSFRIRQAGHRIRYCANSRVIHHESMTPGRSAHEQANYSRLNERWKAIIKPDESPAETTLEVTEIQCRERLLTEPENPRAIATLGEISNRRKDFKQAREWQAQLKKVTHNGKRVPVNVSIVIPVLNNLKMTQQCVNAIEKVSGLVSVEIIVTDNGSTDGTLEFLREAKRQGRLNLIRNETNQGFARASNQGAAQARADLLLFLNNDTLPVPGWLDAMMAAAKHPQVGVVGAKLLYPNNTIQHAGIGWINGVPDHPHRHAHRLAPEVNTPRELDMVTGACFMMPRDLFLQLGGFDEIYRNGVEDIDLCLRVRAAGRKVVYEPKAVVYHLEGQSAGRFNHVNENLKIFFSRWGKSFDKHMNFIVPNPAKNIAASRSLFLQNSKPVSVQWVGSFLDAGSLSHVNRELTNALVASGKIELHRVNTGTEVSPAFKNLATELANATPADAAITVRHAWPPNWMRPKNGKLVVVQPWEFGSLPEQWVKDLANVDEAWVPSEYVRRVYVESGVPENKVFVVPNGVDTKKFHPQVASMKLATQKKFKFLFVGGTIFRKGPDVLLKAYLEAFTAADDVCLVIKDFGGKSVYAGQTFEEKIRAAQAPPNAPQILYLNDELAPEELPGLYRACDCLVLPYRGEGYGLPVAEAMACGLPVMVTAGGATDDFVRDEFGYRIPSQRQIFGNEISGMKLVKPGWLLEPNAAILAERMQWVAAHPDEARERGRLASEHAKKFCSWENTRDIVLSRIEALANTRTEVRVSEHKATVAPRKPSPIVLPACALVGHIAEARELVRHKKFRAAWDSTLAAISKRPFHPEAFLLLAEIALAVNDGEDAKLCADYARRIAPGFKSAKKFLNQRLKGTNRPDWLKVPAQVSSAQVAAPGQLSVCLIVKNEEKFLGQCLKSVRELAQQIVVVDTGSTDRTVEIAKEFGAEVHSFTWSDDFSAARNAALEHVTGDWVLALDADEELSSKDHAQLHKAMSDATAMAWRLPIVDVGRELDGCSFVPRLFRNGPGLFYVGRVHEQIFTSIEVRRSDWGLENKIGEATLIHHGYTQELVRDRNKIERNLQLLEKAVEELPGEAHLLMNLGLELSRSGREAEASTRYQEAFEALSVKPAAEVVPELRESLLSQYCTRLTAAKRVDETVRVLTSPLARAGSGLTASLHFSLGLAHLELKQFSEAAAQMRQCLAKRGQRSLSTINRDILTAAPHHCLAVSLAQLGQVAEAEKTFQTGLKEVDHVAALRLDYARFLFEQKRAVDALQQLNELVAHDARNTMAWRLGGQIALSSPEYLEFARDWTGEAMNHVPDDEVVLAQRAEVLTLSEDTSGARALWEKLWNNTRKPQMLAALILCEAAEGIATHKPENNQDELVASRSFIEWYQKLFAAHAQKTLTLVMAQMNLISSVLPSGARILAAAMAEANKETVGV